MRIGLMVAITVLVAAVGGCGGTSKSGVTAFDKVQANMANAVNTVFSGGKPTTKVTPRQIKRQQAAMWKNFTNLLSGKTANAKP